MTEYAKFIFDYFLKHGEFETNGHFFKWVIEPIEVAFVTTPSGHRQGDVLSDTSYPGMILRDKLIIYYDDHFLRSIGSNDLMSKSHDPNPTTIFRTQLFFDFQDAIMKIAYDHSVRINTNPLQRNYTLSKMSEYPQQ